MTAPGKIPASYESPYQRGSDWNQNVTEAEVHQQAVDKVLEGFGEAYEAQVDLWGEFKSIGDMLDQLRDAILKTDIPVDGPLLDIFDRMDGIDDGVLSLDATIQNVRNFVQDIIDELLRALRKVPIVGGTIADLFQSMEDLKQEAETAIRNADVVQANLTAYQDVISIETNKPLWEGVDPTADSSFPYSQLVQVQNHRHSISIGAGIGSHWSDYTGVSEHHVNPDRSICANVRITRPGSRDYVSFLARRSATPGSLFIDMYRMNDNGSFTLVHSSPDLFPETLTSHSWVTASLPPTMFEVGDVVMIQFRGSNARIAGLQMLYGTQLHQNFRPRNIGMVRNGTAPAEISTEAADLTYAAETPYVGIGTTAVDNPSPYRVFADNFDRAYVGSNWSLLNTHGGSVITLSDGRMSIPARGSYTAGIALYSQPLGTDDVEATWQTSNYRSKNSGVVLKSNADASKMIWLGAAGDGCGIFLVTNKSTWSTKTSLTAPRDPYAVHTWKARYTAADKTYRLFLNGHLIGQWVDNGYEMPIGKGNRFTGVFIETQGDAGPPVDNWQAYDYYQDPGPEEARTWTDSFDRAFLGAEWTLPGGGPVQVDGAMLRGTGASGGVAKFLPTPTTRGWYAEATVISSNYQSNVTRSLIRANFGGSNMRVMGITDGRAFAGPGNHLSEADASTAVPGFAQLRMEMIPTGNSWTFRCRVNGTVIHELTGAAAEAACPTAPFFDVYVENQNAAIDNWSCGEILQ